MDHSGRRARLAPRLAGDDVDALLVTRPANVRYLSGFSGSNGQLLVRIDGSATLLTDGRYGTQAAREAPGVSVRLYAADLASAVAAACRDAEARRVAFEPSAVSVRLHTELVATGLDLVAAADHVERLRTEKDGDERDLIRAAQAIADEAFERLLPKLGEGVSERAAAFELETSIRERTPDGISFDTVVGFGEGAAEPHHHPGDRPLRRGDVVKVDFGAVVDGYHSDATRTVFFGDPPRRLLEIHDVVRRAQEAGIAAVRAGVTAGEVDEAARRVVRDAGYGDGFVHPLGHGVGLEIHEAPMLRAGSRERLRRGAVVTVEPGVYVPGVGGVRIEDMVEVGDEGGTIVSRLPKDAAVL